MDRKRAVELMEKNDGKNLEDLVVQLEGMKLPKGFTIKTRRKEYNDKGVQLAEFDIQIDGNIGSSKFKGLIECRNRPSEGSAPNPSRGAPNAHAKALGAGVRGESTGLRPGERGLGAKPLKGSAPKAHAKALGGGGAVRWCFAPGESRRLCRPREGSGCQTPRESSATPRRSSGSRRTRRRRCATRLRAKSISS